MWQESRFLLKTRVWLFGISTIHQFCLIVYLLSIDFTKASDPKIWYFTYNKFNVLTAWFNIILAVYYPLSWYCDWRILRDQGKLADIQNLSRIREFLFISLTFPIIMYSNTTFWRLWIYNRELICPATIDEMVPYWMQHNMHTYPIIVNILDLFIVKKKRPEDDTVHKRVTLGFICTYIFVCLIFYYNEVYVYAFYEKFSKFALAVMIVMAIFETLLFYHAQWYLTDMLRRFSRNKVI